MSLFDESPKMFFVFIFAKKPWSILKKIYYSIEQWFCVTVFKLTGKETYSRIKSSVPWIVILSTKDAFLKISWRADCINHEISNIQLLREFEPLRLLTIPYLHKKRLCYSIIETERRYPVTDDSELFEAAGRILEKFRCCGQIRQDNQLGNFEQITNGLNVIEEICGGEEKRICENQVAALMDGESFHIGPAHGDFHPKNILKDSKGNHYIIDLDCFRPQGIQALDAIYFVNEYYADQNKISWYKQLILLADKKQDTSPVELPFLERFYKISSLQWLLMYFLDRIGQDRSYVATTAEMPVGEIIDFINAYKKIEIPCHP